MYLVTPENPSTCRIIRAKHNLPFPVLSDPDGRQLTAPLGVWDTDRGTPIPATAFMTGGQLERLIVFADDRARPSGESLLEMVLGMRDGG